MWTRLCLMQSTIDQKDANPCSEGNVQARRQEGSNPSASIGFCVPKCLLKRTFIIHTWHVSVCTKI